MAIVTAAVMLAISAGLRQARKWNAGKVPTIERIPAGIGD